MQYSLVLFSLAASAFAENNLDIKQNLSCDDGRQQQNQGANCGGCGGLPCICKGLLGGLIRCHGGNSDKGPHPFPQPTLTPSTVFSTVTQTHTETGKVTHIDVATSVDTFTTTVTSTHLSTHTQVLHPEKTFTLTRTESFVVWPAYTLIPDNHGGNHGGNHGENHGGHEGGHEGSCPPPPPCHHGHAQGSCHQCH